MKTAEIIKRMDLILDAIKIADDYRPNEHMVADINGFKIGYYDANSPGHRYFVIKHNSIELTRRQNSIAIEFNSADAYDSFQANRWIESIEVKIFKQIIMIDGKKFALVDVSPKEEPKAEEAPKESAEI